jgi:hypothetical protein
MPLLRSRSFTARPPHAPKVLAAFAAKTLLRYPPGTLNLTHKYE